MATQSKMGGTYHSKRLFVCQHVLQDTPFFLHLAQTGLELLHGGRCLATLKHRFAELVSVCSKLLCN